MKQLLLILGLLTAMHYGGMAQKASYDIARFTPPAGWQQADNGGMLSFTNTDSAKGALCLLMLYKSADGSGNADADFSQQWNDKVITPFGVSASPHTNKGVPKDGWDIRVGVDTFSKNGISYMALLTVLSGYHKTMDILVITNHKSYLATLDPFYKSIELQKPSATNAGTGTTGNNNGGQEPAAAGTDAGTAVAAGNMGAISYTLPKGWTEGRSAGGLITAASPLLECTAQSYYTLYVNGVTNYDGDLQEYAKTLHKSYFYQPDPVFQYPEDGRRVVKGIDDKGREYLSYEAPSRVFKTDNSWHYGMVYLVRSGSQVASFMLELQPQNRDKFGPPSAMTIYFLYSCNAVRSAWNKFIASIQFTAPGPTSTYDPADLVGNWECRITLGASIWGYVSSMPLQKYHFTDDGRWQSEKMSVENNFGKYRVSGNKLVITDGAGKTISYRFTLERVFEYNNWTRYISLYDSNGTETKMYFTGD